MSPRMRTAALEWLKWILPLAIMVGSYLSGRARADGVQAAEMQALNKLPERVATLERDADVMRANRQADLRANEAQNANVNAMLQELRSDMKTILREMPRGRQ